MRSGRGQGQSPAVLDPQNVVLKVTDPLGSGITGVFLKKNVYIYIYTAPLIVTAVAKSLACSLCSDLRQEIRRLAGHRWGDTS